MSGVRVAVIGSAGRMGQEIVRLLNEDDAVSTVIGVDRQETAHVSKSVRELKLLEPAEIDVVIDFSSPEMLREILQWSVRSRRALLSGTTGVSEADRTDMVSAGKQIPILWSPNMSLGIAVVAEMLKLLAVTEDFDLQIEELHHKRKKDQPSGTAIFLQERLEQAVGSKLPQPLSIRGGGIFGVHRIWAMGEEEVITLEHTAMNRTVFARGAVHAAKWLASQPPGSYQMADVLNLQSQ